MSSRPTTIELNGKRYDARTGKMIASSDSSAARKAPDPTVIKPLAQTGKSLDGFSRRKSTVSHPKTAAHSVHKKTEKSKTLMRQAVKKPAVTKAKVAPPVVKHPNKRVQLDVDPKRATRAGAVKKSSLISKFGVPGQALKPLTSPLPVKPEPQAPPMPTLDEHHKPTIQAKNDAHKKAMQHAIDKSNAHNQPKAKKTSRRGRLSKKLNVSNRAVNLAAGSLAAVLLVGFVAYQNVPNISMRVATARAGVEGSLPGYQPAGFGLAGPITYSPGQITLSYRSNSDGRNFEVNQRASQWNSETLLENYVATNQRDYQTFQDSGKTIYIYDDNSATWVDGGVWYQIEGKSALNSDQLLRMATSM